MKQKFKLPTRIRIFQANKLISEKWDIHIHTLDKGDAILRYMFKLLHYKSEVEDNNFVHT